MQFKLFDKWTVTRNTQYPAHDPRVYNILTEIGSSSVTGVTVNERTALKHWAVAASVRFISKHFAALPVFPFRRIDATETAPASKERITTGSLFHMVHDEADEWTTQSVWAEASMMHVCLSKGAFSEIEFNERGEAVALHILTPDRVTPVWKNLNGELFLFYEVLPPPGMQGKTVLLPDWQVLHVPSDLPWDGLNGSVVTDYGKDTIGIARAAEISAGKFFKNGGQTSAVIDVPDGIDPKSEQFQTIKKLYEQGSTGLPHQWRYVYNVLGVKYNPTMMEAQKSQLLESRQLSAAEIAGLFGLDPSLIGASNPGGSNVTYANADARMRAFYVGTLRPLCRRFKQEMQKKLIPVRQKGSIIIDYIFDDLQSMDLETRARIYKLSTWLTEDEIRALENRGPKPKQAEPAPQPGPKPENTDQPKEETPNEPVPVRALVRCKELIADTSTRLMKVFAERLEKQTDDTRSAFITEQTTKIRSALLPTFHVYASLLDGDALADELLDQHVGELLKEHTNVIR